MFFLPNWIRKILGLELCVLVVEIYPAYDMFLHRLYYDRQTKKWRFVILDFCKSRPKKCDISKHCVLIGKDATMAELKKAETKIIPNRFGSAQLKKM